jgi:hypothetical protein
MTRHLRHQFKEGQLTFLRTLTSVTLLVILLSACGGRAPAPSSAFRITEFNSDSSIQWNSQIEAQVSWVGNPVFPIEGNWEIIRCDTPNFSCDRSPLIFEEEENPLVINRECFCSGSMCNQTVTFEGFYRFTDAAGQVADSERLVTTCRP